MKSEVKKGKKKYKKSVVVQCYLALSPQVIGFFVFSVYPIVWVLSKSFTDYNGIRGGFIGTANYIRAFTQDDVFWNTIGNTFILTAMKMIMEIPLAFLLAMLLCNKALKARRLFNTLLYRPSVVGVATVAMIFSYMFRTYNGLMNNLFEAIGIISAPINWLGEKWIAFFVIALMSTWMTFPINMMYFCGAVAGVPQEVYESAKIDGCKGLRKIFSITLPMIAPTFKVILMLALTGSMRIMNEVMLLTKGGPQGKTNVVMLYLYNIFFGIGTSESGAARTEIGYASACSIIVTIIIGIVTVFYLIFTKKADELY